MSDSDCDCSRLVALLSEYLEGHLPDHLRRDLEAHLSGCKECSAFVGTYQSTVSLLRTLKEEDLPEELRVRLRAFLDHRCNS